MSNNRHRRNAPVGNKNFMKVLMAFRDLILNHSRIVFPIILIACVAITVVIALNAGKAKNAQTQEASTESTDLAEAEMGVPVTTEELKNNAYPEVNALIMDYFNALAAGDVDKVLSLSSYVDETEKIRIQELSKYVDSYPSVEIYTKPGPIAESYLAYVNYQVKFNGYDSTAPGIQTFYICTAEDGSLYMNEGAVEEYVTEYIQQVNMQEDVVELFNRVAVEYNDLLVNDPNLSIFLQELNTQMDISVGEALAAAEAEQAQEEQPSDEAAEGETPEELPEGDKPAEQEQQAGPVKARTTTTINVRSSDSETADKLGKLEGGTSLEILEVRPNGWSKIMYNGKEAYVKTDYLEMVQAENAEGVETTGTVTATDNVNIRSSADENAEKLGVVYKGEKLDLILKQNDGWCKVKYKGQVAYVKSDYVE